MDFGSFNLGNVGSALKLTGSDYELPQGLGQAAQPAASSGWQLPASTNGALQATGSTYRAPVAQQPAPTAPVAQAHDSEVAGSGGAGSTIGNLVGGLMDGATGKKEQASGDAGADDQRKAANGLGKIAGLVAKFYTGGIAGAAGGLASQSGSQSGSNAGQAMGLVSSFL